MNPDLLHIRGRWMTMTTATRCVHHTSLADKCEACGLTGRLEDFTDAQLLAECDRRRLFVPVAVEPAPATPPDDGRDDLRALPAVPPTPPERPAKKARK